MKPTDSRHSAPSFGIVTGLVAPLALGAPGNLDPGFADHGRTFLGSAWASQAWTVEALDDGGVFLAGGRSDCEQVSGYLSYYDCDFGDNFASELTSDGTQVETFDAGRPIDIDVRDAARQPDGKIIMVGLWANDADPEVQRLAVYQLEASGALDVGFGIFLLPSDVHGARNYASSVVLDPDGRIVVSGSSADRLIVLRLLIDGTLDASFGEGGVFTGPIHDYGSRTFIERTAAGYRVSTMDASRCQIVGLTSSGVTDNSFGTAGVAPVQTAQGEATACSAMASQPDGSLLLSGTAAEQPFVMRMLATGTPDPAFSAGAIADLMTDATAIAVDGTGRTLVAGSGEPGIMVTRLDSGGGLDAAFGEAGTTIIDLPTFEGSMPTINALDVGPDGRLLAAGGDSYLHTPFVVELSGDVGGDSPGILSIVRPTVEAAEGDDLVVKVRRTGGKSGAVSVAYASAGEGAIPGDDYDEVAGTLAWADGDASEREIVVPIRIHSGAPEALEGLRVVLSDPQGGAGLGTQSARATILADGAPAGQFEIGLHSDGGESGVAEFVVYRNYYDDGEVSVTVTPVPGTASVDDFDATPITLTWADQDSTPKFVQVEIVNDSKQELSESFTVELSNPTGGAVVGPHAIAINSIRSNDYFAGSGGGGSTGWLSLLLLGLAELIRRSRALPATLPRLRARR